MASSHGAITTSLRGCQTDISNAGCLLICTRESAFIKRKPFHTPPLVGVWFVWIIGFIEKATLCDST